MNLYIRELKANLRALIIWCLGITIFIAMASAKFSTFSQDPGALNDLSGKFPKVVRVLTGIYDFDMSTISGYYAVCFTYLLLLGAIFAVVIGSNIIAKEEIIKTSEFLYVKPISRFKIITYKLLAALTNITVFTVILWVISVIMVSHYESESPALPFVNKLILSMLFLQIIFMTLGTALSILRNQAKKASGMATGLVLVTFFISLFINLEEKLRYFDFLSPFRYFKIQDLTDHSFEWRYLVLSTAVVIASMIIVYRVGGKKDLKN